ncbi:hypothetical protein [Krasilnikovia sp. MM14-A1004]|uniref:hypothetical protein n=1 Tax=Krasilnikovia sp. MM14-A1004 TaxID=3373541 RepID=UPI00399D1EB4
MGRTAGDAGPGYTRRRLLGVTAGAALAVGAPAGCGLFGDDPEPARPDPLQPVLDEALRLAAGYDRAALTQPALGKRLAPLAADHRAHAAALAPVIGAAPASAAPSASADAGAAPTLDALRRAEQQAQRTAAAACRETSADRAALVGSIAACRAAHAEALR